MECKGLRIPSKRSLVLLSVMHPIQPDSNSHKSASDMELNTCMQ